MSTSATAAHTLWSILPVAPWRAARFPRLLNASAAERKRVELNRTDLQWQTLDEARKDSTCDALTLSPSLRGARSATNLSPHAGGVSDAKLLQFARNDTDSEFTGNCRPRLTALTSIRHIVHGSFREEPSRGV